MLTDSFRNIFHVETYALIGFVIFFSFFVIVSIRAFRMDKKEVAELSNMPLDDQEPTNEKER
ncbi:MAG: CcoQ/FixQ family Cbb3-type cytochrome c oxidase assembly chaperone [Bacteroidota bacterium]|nr:CcoQ/FixQ family Cbb3-type cytochrome c oxidase assembly chaperone [Odoribacter sp.]MDP3644516.1 CcoQ/FixQ family Cbb3-type cytochrome c oxidase assembly chaperone [Bacteroidota bacterium]